MTVRIESLGLVIPGQVTRKFDGTNTVLTVTAEQARSIYDALATVNHFFELQDPPSPGDPDSEVS